MAIHRGIQSAIFYYLSCAPCAEARYRKKRKQEAIRGRADREALEAEMGPNLYRHPSPSSTNPYWQSEIAAGPVLASRGGKRKNTPNATDGSRAGLKSSMTQRSDGSNVPSSVDLSSGGPNRDGRVDSKWQFQQFQRDDEPWSTSASTERLGSSRTVDEYLAVDGITRPQNARTKAPESEKNPQINDLHPATVTKIRSREEAKWLMAPPPTADFMSGKDRDSRSRSDSGGSSRLSARSGVPLSREVSRRIVEQKMRNGDWPLTPTLSRESTVQTSSDPNGQRHDISATDEKDFALDDSPTNRIKILRSPPIQAPEGSMESSKTVIRSPDMAPEPVRPRKVASRPQLSTIISDSLDATGKDDDSRLPKENIRHSDDTLPEPDRNARRSALLGREDSLQVLRELAPGSSIFKTNAFAKQNQRPPNDALKRTRLPSQDASEERRLEGGPEMFDSWYTPDFKLPDWIHEHTKREVTQRWSMDI